MKRVTVLMAVLVLMLVTLSCMKTLTGEQMTAKQQATVWLSVYNAQYDDTYAIMTNPNSTPAQKDMGQRKKAVLTQLWPMLKGYVMLVDGGGTPTATDIATITNLINQLTTLVPVN